MRQARVDLREEKAESPRIKLFYCIADGLSYSTDQEVSTHLRFAHGQERQKENLIRERTL